MPPANVPRVPPTDPTSLPGISVLLPVRDAEATLDEAIASIRAQSFPGWELIAVDDGSTDASPEILCGWAGRDPRIRTIRRPPRGIVPALETARRAARAPLLARMDADDRSHPGRLEAQLERLEARPGTVLVGAHVRYFPRRRVREGARRYEGWLASLRSPADLDRDLWVECPLAHPTFLARADAVAAVGGYREVEGPEDYDLLLRLRLAGGGLDVVPRVLLDWREGAGRLSRTDPRYAPEAFRRLKLRHLRQGPLGERDGLLIWGAGPVGKAFARTALALGIEVRAFVDVDPRKIGQEVHGAPVVARDEVRRFRGALGVAAVGREGARDDIRRSFRELGWREGRDFVAVA